MPLGPPLLTTPKEQTFNSINHSRKWSVRVLSRLNNPLIAWIIALAKYNYKREAAKK